MKHTCPYCGRDALIGKVLDHAFGYSVKEATQNFQTNLNCKTNAIGNDEIDTEIESQVNDVVENSPTYNDLQFAQINTRLDELENTFLSALERTRKYFSTDENKTSPSDRWRVTVGAATACSDSVNMIDSLIKELDDAVHHNNLRSLYDHADVAKENHVLKMTKGRLNAIRKRLLDRP